MRIAVLGKGGSGKTTIAAAFIKHFSKKKSVLAIDADVNVHLGSLLNIPNGVAVGHLFREVAQFVKGSRTDVEVKNMVATTPPSIHSRFITVSKDDPFIQKYCSTKGPISLLTIGTYEEKDLGHTCYHGKLNTLELIYHHLLDTHDDIVIGDVTAGIDNLGTSLYFSYDVNVFVVEPTLKSINVYTAFEKIASKHNIPTYVVLNKIEKDTDLEFVHKYIPADKIIGVIPYSSNVKLVEQGNVDAFDSFLKDIEPELAKIESVVLTHSRNWNAYYETLLETHVKNSVEWWDSYYATSVSKQKDPEFSYEKVL